MFDLLGLRKVVPPRAELVGVFDYPSHGVNSIPSREYCKAVIALALERRRRTGTLNAIPGLGIFP